MEDAARAAVLADRAWYVRPQSFDQINTALIDARCYAAGSNKEVFALAMSDIGQAHFVRSSGVPLALLAVYTNKPEYLERALDILSEMRSHRPLQRQGWTAYLPSAQLAAGGDGVFLGTSWGLNGIIDMLTILGDRVPSAIRSDLESLIREEVSRIAKDWAEERPWYVKGRTVQSNQWIEPSLALARACLFLKDRRLDAAYNLATENLASSLATFSEDGAFAEGVTYASMTVGPMFDLLDEMARSGDLRCQQYPYVRNAWKWFLHMHMPGGRYVNCFDSRMGFVPAWALRTPLPSLISAAMGSGDPLAVERLRSFFPVGDASLTAVRYQAAIGAAGAPAAALGDLPTYAHFPSQALLTWRSRWEAPSGQQTAMGVWVRGGSITDSHSHRDQGHLSVYWGSRPILIEAGTPDYSNPDMEPKYASAAGHSIMQVSELRPRGRAVAVPLSIARLDSEGGRVSMDTSAAYVAPVQSCSRSVEWDRSGVVEISDAVVFTTYRPAATEIYRLHLGARTAVEIRGTAYGWAVAWPGTLIEIRSSESIDLRQQMWPDADAPGSEHVALSIVCAGPIQSLQLATTVTVQPDP